MNLQFGNLGVTQQAVLRVLRRRGAASRAELAASCGVTPAAIGMATRGLVDAGFVTEGARRHVGRGAPHIDLVLAGDIGLALGIHATRHAISLSLMDFAGKVRGEAYYPGNYSTFAEVCERIASGVQALQAGLPRSIPLIGAGLAMPTRFYSRSSEQLPFRVLNLAEEVVAWGNDGITRQLSALLSCPVHVENDANAAAIGEMSLGNRDGYRDFAYLYLSEGIGGSLILNDELYRGHLGNAGEFGALRPRTISRPSFDNFARHCQEHGRRPPPADRDIAAWERYCAGEPKAVESWLARATDEVAQLIYPIAAIVAPQAVFIGGTLPLPLRRELSARVDLTRHDFFDSGVVVAPEVLLSTISARDAVAFGAAANVLHLLGAAPADDIWSGT